MATAKRIEAEVDFAALETEAVRLLRDYVTIDTTNPPGDVSKAADWVEAALRAEGIETLRLGPAPEKANVVATIGEGDARGRGLVLAHHMDVVPAVREDWSAEPFGGELREGFVWGRGTLDMKGFGVLSMLCARTLKRLGLPLSRPLRILATADEEVGGIGGAKWLAANHLDAVGGEFLLTEGSFARAGPRATYYAVQVAEKGVSTAKLTARGQPGHASSPREDNAVVRIGRALAKIGEYRSPPAALDLARRYLSAFPPRALRLPEGRTVGGLSDVEMEELLYRLSGGSRIQNMLRNTFSPTMVNAGLGQNVIPPLCEAYVDCRTVPGVSSEGVLEELAQVIGDQEVQLELVKSSVGTESPAESELFGAIRQAVHGERPEAIVVPYLTSGGTDCKHFRPHGIVCYGHIPFELDDSEAERIHGVDERVSVENLGRALRVLWRVVVGMCAGNG
ncbi:MAG: M20/M25/M40 family metallo-hydrolase [Dehalococcoidia bacterium]|nr:M20/M25/M40 family metallo-hydrolase [Dehalococcoidia bacterium]